MRFLLDSHVVVWWAVYPSRLTNSTRDLLIAPANEVFISAASAWELGIKQAKGKLKLPDDYLEKLMADGFEELPISAAHAIASTHLPSIHADPFDRLLIAQAKAEAMTFVTKDQVIGQYDVRVLAA